MSTSRKGVAGAAVYRGPMATDNFVQIHNLVARGKTPINTRYVGVWAFITSHVEGWKLTEQGIARELSVGRDFVRSALKCFEDAMCLFRVRERGRNGELGGAAWFVTDLPIQLQQLGITDDATVRARVLDEYERWQSFRRSQPMLENQAQDVTSGNALPSAPTAAEPVASPRSQPMAENPTQDATSGNTPYPHTTDSSSPSSEPVAGFPKLAEPTLDFPPPKKTNPQEDQPSTSLRSVEEDSSVRPVDPRAGASDIRPAAERSSTAAKPDGRTDGLSEQHHLAARTLLAEEDVRSAVVGLKPWRSQLATLTELVASALDRFEVDRVRGYLLAKCRETTHRNVGYLLAAFKHSLVDDIADARPVEHIDVRSARRTEQAREARVAAEARWDRINRAGEEAPAAPPSPSAPGSSPVDWLTDAQFAELSFQDRAFVRIWAESTGRVPKYTADRIAWIRSGRPAVA